MERDKRKLCSGIDVKAVINRQKVEGHHMNEKRNSVRNIFSGFLGIRGKT
jgi:hypothetical protein